MLTVENLSSGYGKETVISNASLSVLKNELNIILGPNGSGKSTLLKTIAGVLNKTKGNIYINETDFFSLSFRERGREIAYMSQERPVPDMIVHELLLCARYPYLDFGKSYGEEDYSCISKAVLLTGIEALENRKLKTLSGGERQKVYIAMALSQGTDVILLDEPITYLDIKNQFEIMELIKSIKKEKSILMVCHDIRMSLKYADKLIVMDKGRIIDSGTREEILSSKSLEKIFGVNITKTESTDDYIINMEK